MWVGGQLDANVVGADEPGGLNTRKDQVLMNCIVQISMTQGTISIPQMRKMQLREHL